MAKPSICYANAEFSSAERSSDKSLFIEEDK
jgi:hypothetical protein